MSSIDDLRSETATERLLDDSWESRGRRLARRELVSELIAGGLFVVAAGALLLVPGATSGFDPATAGVLVALYVALSGVEFAVGAGNVLPTQLVLIPMLVLLPPASVPLLVAAGRLAWKLIDWARGRGSLDHVLFAVPDGWHALGPAALLVLAGADQLELGDLPLLAAAFVCCCVVDAGSAILRDAAARGVAPSVQLGVFATVWLVDACLAPIGFLAAEAAQRNRLAIVLVLPLAGLLLVLAADRRRRIEQAQQRLAIAVRERGRLQRAVRRMGDAFAAKLDLQALIDIMLQGSIEALDADAGWLQVDHQPPRRFPDDGASELDLALGQAGELARATGLAQQIQHPGGWALALPFAIDAPQDAAVEGALCLTRRTRPFHPDELELLGELVAKARAAATDILAHHALRTQASHDALTGLGNRRKLASDVTRWLSAPDVTPRLLMLFDLDGFKAYNDTFGHLAGDALLTRMGAKLSAEVAPHGAAYRLGGDEFCALLELDGDRVEELIALAADALSETGEEFSVTASYGAVVVPHEADALEHALLLADERMYSHKHSRRSVSVREQARDVLMRTMHAKQPSLREHSSEVAELAVAVARRLGMSAEEIDEIARAAELHDVGKVGIPDAILNKPGPLDAHEWAFMRQHTILGERILNGAPALRPVARLVRSSHERWDGTGYPDGLTASEIPHGARIVAVCDAYEAMTSDRVYRPALSHDAAREELRAMAGSQFDPDVVDAFLTELCDRCATDAEPASAPVHDVAERVRALLAKTD